MASPNLITKTIELEGVPLTLAATLNFYRRFHRITGRDLVAGVNVPQPDRDEAGEPVPGTGWKPTIEDTIAMLYCAAQAGRSEALKGKSDDEGMDYVGDLVHSGNLKEAMGALNAVMSVEAPADPLPAGPEEAQPTG